MSRRLRQRRLVTARATAALWPGPPSGGGSRCWTTLRFGGSCTCPRIALDSWILVTGGESFLIYTSQPTTCYPTA